MSNAVFHFQELQVCCAEGHALLNTALRVREELLPCGVPQLEDRLLEFVRQDWTIYQQKLSEVRTQLNTTLSKLRLMEDKFLKVDNWLKTLEDKVNFRTGRQSDRATKDLQMQQMKVTRWYEYGHYSEPVYEDSMLNVYFWNISVPLEGYW